LRSEEVVENHKEEGKVEQIEVTYDLHREKGKEVSTEASSALTPILELPRGHENSLLLLLDEQTEVIKVEKLFKYSPHSISIHDSLLDEKLFENFQSDLPRSVKIRNYLSVGRIHSLWSKRRKDWCFKFKFKSYYQQRSSKSRSLSTSAQISGTEAIACTKNPYPLKNSGFVFNYSSFYFG
jgi:hypothetical protein